MEQEGRNGDVSRLLRDAGLRTLRLIPCRPWVTLLPGRGADMADDGEGDGGAGEAVVCLRFLCDALVTEAALGLEFPGKPPHSNDVRPVQMCSICQRKTRNKHVLRVVRSCSCRWRQRKGEGRC